MCFLLLRYGRHFLAIENKVAIFLHESEVLTLALVRCVYTSSFITGVVSDNEIRSRKDVPRLNEDLSDFFFIKSRNEDTYFACY